MAFSFRFLTRGGVRSTSGDLFTVAGPLLVEPGDGFRPDRTETRVLFGNVAVNAYDSFVRIKPRARSSN